MTGPRYFRLAMRLPVFEGVLAARLKKLDAEQEEASKPMTPAEYIAWRKRKNPNLQSPINKDEQDTMKELMQID